ncbi:MAG: hypothetical protein HQL31_12200, partial [Planctomycetes bacterium]|nr:hypothetical protein [Planctomycetota bacterium]
MAIRLYQFAREFNYSISELQEKGRSEGLDRLCSFSMLPDPQEAALRKLLPKREPNECLKREKAPAKKTAAKKTSAKKKILAKNLANEEATVTKDVA